MARRGETVFLTGATGFVGRHVARALLDSGHRVKVLVRPAAGGDESALRSRLAADLRDEVEPVPGDLLSAGHLVDALRGSRYLIHSAALYSFAPADRGAIRDTNVRGTASLMEAARIAEVEKVVVTSSSATVGPARDGRPATETDYAPDHDRGSSYHRSKIEQERVALAAQIPTVIVLPTAPVGPGDAKPTPTGKMIVDFMRGRMVATLSGGLNVVPVEDVARAHVLALEQGEPSERYIVGGENLKLSGLFGLLAGICGRAAPKREVPYRLALAIGVIDEIRCRVRPSGVPLVPLEGVQMGRQVMYVSSEKARSSLGYAAGPVVEALERAVSWYRANGYA